MSKTEEREFVFVDVTTRVKIYTDSPEFAETVAIDTAQNMGTDEYLRHTTMEIGRVRTESDETEEFSLANKEFNIWGYAIDSRTFMLEVRHEEEDEPLEAVIDLDDYPSEYVCQSEMIYFADQKSIEVPDSIKDIELAALIFSELEGF